MLGAGIGERVLSWYVCRQGSVVDDAACCVLAWTKQKSAGPASLWFLGFKDLEGLFGCYQRSHQVDINDCLEVIDSKLFDWDMLCCPSVLHTLMSISDSWNRIYLH